MIIKKYRSRILCLILATLLTAAVMTGCSSDPQPQTGPSNETQGGTKPPEPSVPLVTAPEEEPYTEPPTAPPVQVVMPEYEMSYAGEMADIISWESESDGLAFYVQIEGGKYRLFTLLLNQIEGELVTMKENTEGEQIPVSFLMEPVPEELSRENTQIFCLAQDLVNDMIASLTLK